MPIYFNNLLYDYYLVNCTILLLGCISIIGIIFSYLDMGNIESIVCVMIAIGLFAWCLVIARVNIAIYDNLFVGYLTGFIILLTILSIIQILFMSTYIKYASTNSLYRILFIFVLVLAGMTRWYHADIGNRTFNILTISATVCGIFVVSTMLSFKFRYYLYYKSSHIDTYFPISR